MPFDPSSYTIASWPVWTTATNTILTTTGTTSVGSTYYPNFEVYGGSPPSAPEKTKAAKPKPAKADPIDWLHGRVDEYVALGQLD